MKEINIDIIQKIYQNNLDMLQNEINDTDELYEELKIHFDSVKKSRSSGVLTFISKQTPNLVSLKKNKIDLIKEINNVTKNIIDSTIKLSSDDEDGLDKDSLVLKELHDMLLNNSSEFYLQKMEENKDKKEELIEQDFDAELEEALNKNNSNKEKETKQQKKKKNKDRIKYTIVVDEERNLYAIDEDYNILDDSDDLVPDDWIIDFNEDDDGNIINAINQFDEEIEVISFDEDDE